MKDQRGKASDFRDVSAGLFYPEVESPRSGSTYAIRIAELEERLRRVTMERDAALKALDELKAAGAEPPAVPIPILADGMCKYCDGEGTIWVHDFEMDCKRCMSTGRTPGPTA